MISFSSSQKTLLQITLIRFTWFSGGGTFSSSSLGSSEFWKGTKKGTKGTFSKPRILSFRLLLLHSSWVRFQLMNLRMHRYFNDSKDIDALKSFFNNSSHGDW